MKEYASENKERKSAQKASEETDRLKEIIRNAPDDMEILNTILVMDDKLKHCTKALCAISGGSDSDLVLDLCAALDEERKVTYAFYDTGLEFQATKAHLQYLQDRYHVTIHMVKAGKPIPVCCREYGVPFLSKRVSDYISRLQNHGFTWEDKPLPELEERYPNCKTALKWWCNAWGPDSQFNIARHPWLKEFMTTNPPTFKISSKCCDYAKKKVAKQLTEKGDYDLNITGVRRAEGGVRATAYKSCFSPATDKKIAQYRPLFWFRQETKRQYEAHYGIRHSACYEIWGLKRTGCSGCPFAKNFEYELAATEKYEPKLYRALQKVFGLSYAYTRQYRAFQKEMNERAVTSPASPLIKGGDADANP